MIRFAIYFLFLLGSVWLGIKIAESPGYVLISYQHWALETTLWFATIATIVSFFALYFAARFLITIFSLGSSISRWSANRKNKKIREVTNMGLRALAEGNYHSAEKYLTISVGQGETPLINYLGAAHAAQGRGDIKKRDEYLHLAQQCSDNSEVAVGLTQAQLEQTNLQFEQAVSTLENLKQTSPHHHTVLKLLCEAYVELEDWDALLKLLPELKKQKVLIEDDYEGLESLVHEEHFRLISSKLRPDELEQAWKQLPRNMQYDAPIVIEYTNALMKHNDHENAEKITRNALDHSWNDKLARQYAKINLPNSSKQLKHAEAWLATHPESCDLLVCCGQLCLRNKLWGKARSFFETVLSLQPSAHALYALHDLGRVYEALDDKQLALDCYKKALQQVIVE